MRMALLLTEETNLNSPFRILKDEVREHINENTDPFLAYKFAQNRFNKYDSSKDVPN